MSVRPLAFRPLARALAADRRGVAALEFALLLPVLGTLLLGVADFALAGARARDLEALAAIAAAAARAAGPEGLARVAPAPLARATPPAPPDTGNMAIPPLLGSGVVANLPASLAGDLPGVLLPQGAADLPLDRLVTLPQGTQGSLSLFAGCADGRAGLGRVAPSARCADGRAPALFARIRLEATVARLLPWPGALLADEVATELVVRID